MLLGSYCGKEGYSKLKNNLGWEFICSELKLKLMRVDTVGKKINRK